MLQASHQHISASRFSAHVLLLPHPTWDPTWDRSRHTLPGFPTMTCHPSSNISALQDMGIDAVRQWRRSTRFLAHSPTMYRQVITNTRCPSFRSMFEDIRPRRRPNCIRHLVTLATGRLTIVRASTLPILPRRLQPPLTLEEDQSCPRRPPSLQARKRVTAVASGRKTVDSHSSTSRRATRRRF